MPAAPLTKSALFDRLAAGHAARVSVVTPNLRLAQELSREFDRYQLARGLALWDAPDIVSFAAFVTRAYEDALYSDLAAGLPVVLTAAQEQALWEGIVGRTEEATGRLLALPQAAAAARDAWKTAHEWRLLGALKEARRNEDAEAFAAWAERYERLTRRDGHTESARLPDVVAGLLAQACIRKPALLVRFGFDIVTMQQDAFFAALEAQGCAIATCAPQGRGGSAVRVRCADTRDEIRQAARWARQRLEAGPQVRIGIVVPDLAQQRNALRRTFTQVMGPGHVQPFNISLGEPLASHPLVDAAFLTLELAGRAVAFERASGFMRSPFIGAAEAEMAQRARLDAAVRRRAEPELTLERLVALAGAQAPRARAPALERVLGQLAEFRKARLFGAQSPAEWGRAFSDALALAGFPGERALDSAEYQTLKKWHDVLSQFAQLERVVPRMGYGEAVARLRRMAADTAFQPESPEVPVQILGVLESAGCEFDHLWVMGLSVDAWPLAARPNPFLPLALQRAAGIPESSADASLELDRRITQGWLGAAGEVVFSHPAREADRELAPSPLVAAIPEHALDLPAYPSLRDALFAGRLVERIEDAAAPALASREAQGGSALIKDQAACPFRAFARHRLGSEGLEAPHAGLDALERGSLVHRVLAAAWEQLETKHALDSISDAELRAILDKAADDAVARQKRDRPSTLGGRFAQVEKRRLARLARDWLHLERGRGDFSVFAIEAKRSIEVGGLQLGGRLDRVDETADGQRIVIDYKTRAPAAGAWLGERPDEPQLPLYLTAAEPRARAIAFAQVKAGDMKLVALAADKDILPGARTLPDGRLKKAAENWDAQLAAWRDELDRLARDFAAGKACVDPKPRACDYCDQQPFCRIHEREGGLGEDDEAAA
ncbi:MAG: PD-(D/E)XK nuclease family protein [Proteobacteria bacterium]|nr:PD-(D/E)XK nuclease family protein [Pseudomonadota bacterium]